MTLWRQINYVHEINHKVPVCGTHMKIANMICKGEKQSCKLLETSGLSLLPCYLQINLIKLAIFTSLPQILEQQIDFFQSPADKNIFCYTTHKFLNVRKELERLFLSPCLKERHPFYIWPQTAKCIPFSSIFLHFRAVKWRIVQCSLLACTWTKRAALVLYLLQKCTEHWGSIE